jgi:hypothetical protein
LRLTIEFDKSEKHEIKSVEAITDTIKSNWKNRESIKICQIQN